MISVISRESLTRLVEAKWSRTISMLKVVLVYVINYTHSARWPGIIQIMIQS